MYFVGFFSHGLLLLNHQKAAFKLLFRLGLAVSSLASYLTTWSCNLCMQNIDTFLIILLMCAGFKILNSSSLRNKLGSVPQGLTETVQGTSKSHCQHHTDTHKAKTNSPQSPAHIRTRLHGKQAQKSSIHMAQRWGYSWGGLTCLLWVFFLKFFFLLLLFERNDWIKVNSPLS